ASSPTLGRLSPKIESSLQKTLFNSLSLTTLYCLYIMSSQCQRSALRLTCNCEAAERQSQPRNGDNSRLLYDASNWALKGIKENTVPLVYYPEIKSVKMPL